MANAERSWIGSRSICAIPRPASLSMTDHRCGPPSPKAAKSKSPGRSAVSNVTALVGPRDAVGPHANNSRQNGSRYGKPRFFTTLRLPRAASPAQGVVRRRRPPLRVAQSGIHRGPLPRPGNRRRPKTRRRDRLDQLRFVRNDFAAQRRRVRLTSLTARAPDQYLKRSAREQTANEIRWGELEACFRPCALTSTSRALHSSWTGASRGDCSSPDLFIIQRSDKCNGSFYNQ